MLLFARCPCMRSMWVVLQPCLKWKSANQHLFLQRPACNRRASAPRRWGWLPSTPCWSPAPGCPYPSSRTACLRWVGVWQARELPKLTQGLFIVEKRLGVPQGSLLGPLLFCVRLTGFWENLERWRLFIYMYLPRCCCSIKRGKKKN